MRCFVMFRTWYFTESSVYGEDFREKWAAGSRVACLLRAADAVVVASLQVATDRHLQLVVIGVVKQSDFWEDEMLHSPALFVSCFIQAPKLRGLVVDHVDKLSDVLSSDVFREFAAVLPRLDIEVIGEALRIVSTSFFHGVEL